MLLHCRDELGWSLVLWLICSASVTGQPPTETAPDEDRQAQKLKFYADELSKLSLSAADDPEHPYQFVEQPVFRFENPISRILDGFMFLWTEKGRPVAVVKSYYVVSTKSWGRTFVSIAPQPLLLRMGDQDLWTPREAGVKFVELQDAPPPAEQPAQRLIQMRNIARRFQIIDHWGIQDPKDWTLRLLPAPLYRYEVPTERVVDGAMFGYVLTSSPEALVLIEDRETPQGRAWYYAVSRSTRFEIRVQLDDKSLVNFQRLDAWPATGTYFHLSVPMEQRPFAGPPAN